MRTHSPKKSDHEKRVIITTRVPTPLLRKPTKFESHRVAAIRACAVPRPLIYGVATGPTIRIDAAWGARLDERTVSLRALAFEQHMLQLGAAPHFSSLITARRQRPVHLETAACDGIHPETAACDEIQRPSPGSSCATCRSSVRAILRRLHWAPASVPPSRHDGGTCPQLPGT